MALEDKICRKEEAFFNEFLRRPNTIILRPDTKAVLLEEVCSSEEGNYEDLLIMDIDSYMGMVISVTLKEGFPDFKLAISL